MVAVTPNTPQLYSPSLRWVCSPNNYGGNLWFDSRKNLLARLTSYTAGPAQGWGVTPRGYGCARFGAANYFSIGTANVSILDGKPFSVCAWISSTDNGAGGSMAIITSWKQSTSAGFEFGIGYQVAGVVNLFLTNANGGAGRYNRGSIAVNDGAWHHIAAVYDGTNVTFYVDGRADTTTNALNTSPGALVDGNWQIGGRLKSTGALAALFNGNIDDIRIYNTALPASFVRSIYLAPVGLPSWLSSREPWTITKLQSYAAISESVAASSKRLISAKYRATVAEFTASSGLFHSKSRSLAASAEGAAHSAKRLVAMKMKTAASENVVANGRRSIAAKSVAVSSELAAGSANRKLGARAQAAMSQSMGSNALFSLRARFFSAIAEGASATAAMRSKTRSRTAASETNASSASAKGRFRSLAASNVMNVASSIATFGLGVMAAISAFASGSAKRRWAILRDPGSGEPGTGQEPIFEIEQLPETGKTSHFSIQTPRSEHIRRH